MWINCPPSARINSYFPESKGEAAEEGTRAHETAEKILKGELQETDDPNVTFYVNFVRGILSENPSARFHIEQQVDYSHIAPKGFGTSDAIIVTDDTFIIVDYKNGVDVEVSAVENSQMRLYALGAVKKFHFKGEQVRMVIVQPKTKSKVSEETISHQELIWWGNRIKPRAYMAWEGSGIYKAGEHCRWCKFKHLCPEYQKLFKELYIDSLYEIRRK